LHPVSEYYPKLWHVAALWFIALICGVISRYLASVGWLAYVIAGLFILAGCVILIVVAYAEIAHSVDRVRSASARLLEAAKDTSDERLALLGIALPEWDVDTTEIAPRFYLRTTHVTAGFFVEIMTHPETDGVYLCPVRRFVNNRERMDMARQVHELGQRKGWLEPYRGNETSRFRNGWTPRRVLALYGFDLPLPDLSQADYLLAETMQEITGED